MTRHTLSVLVEDQPGVLARIASLFSRRGFNIESLAVGPTEHRGMSRMTIVVNVDDLPLEQVTKQLNKLVNVLKIVELDPSTVRAARAAAGQGQGRRRHPLAGARDRPALPRQGGRRRPGRRRRSRPPATPTSCEALLRVLEPFGIKELVQSGMVAVGRGPRSITDRTLRSADRSA